MDTRLKRFLSLALAVFMVFSMVPNTAFATSAEDTPTETTVEAPIETTTAATTEAPSTTTEAPTTETSTETQAPSEPESTATQAPSQSEGETTQGENIPETTQAPTEAPVAQIDVEATDVAKIGDQGYATLADAAAAAKAGDEIVLLTDVAEGVTLPAGVIFNGNGKTVGAIVANGDITFKGHTKAVDFDFAYSNSTVNIVEGACLEFTGGDRLVVGHGATFNITGTITDAKTADKATIQPSLIMPGASFTGAGVIFNVTNAYISVPSSYSSTSNSASGTFDFNIENSIWESAGKLAFESGSTAATVDFELKDSVLTTGSHLVFGSSNGKTVIDNSNVNVGTSRQLENRSTMTIKNGSVVNGAVATSSNAINPGTVIVENATYAVTGQFSGAAVGTGTLVIKKGATVSVGSIVDKANVVIDATGMAAGDEVNFTANLSKFTGTVEVKGNDKLEAEIVDGKIVLKAKPVAKIGDKGYETIAAAIAAAQTGDTVVIAPGEYSAINISNKNITIAGTVGANGELLTTIKGGNPAITGHGFNGTIKDLKIVDAFKVMYAEPAGNVTVDNVYVTGATYGFHLIAYSKGLSWNIQNSYMDLSWANSFGVYGDGDAAITIKGNEFASTAPYYPDYGALPVNTFLPNVTVEENIFGAKTKIALSVNDTSKVKIGANYYVDGYANAFADDTAAKVDITKYYAELNTDGTINKNSLVEAPRGNNFNGYTSSDAIWGEVRGNATKSFVIKVLDANGNVMGTTSLNNIGGIIDGDVNVTWALKLDAASNTDEYWTMEWTTAPSVDNMPAKVELWVDGVKVSGGNVVLNGPDDINKIVAAVADNNGVITGFYTKLVDAINAASKARTTGNAVCVLRDVTEPIETLENVTLTTNVAGGVTITSTYDDYVDFNNVTVKNSVTLDIPYVYASGADSENTIEGTLKAGTLYNARDAKTTVQNGGKIITTGMIVNRYHTDADAGIYVIGDGDNSTVEVSCANTIGTYSGTFHAEDAVVEANMLWIDYLKDGTTEADTYTQSKPVFENSVVKITKELRFYKDATLTLTDSSVTAGKVQIRENATPELALDNSSIKADSVENLAGASMNAVLGADGTVSFVEFVAKIGTQSYATLQEAFKAATEGCTIEILDDVTISEKWDCRDYATGGSHSQFKESVTINGNGHTIKFTGTINDNNWNTVFRFEENATVKNLTVDISAATGAQRVISAKKSLTVDGLTIIGSAKYGVIFGEGASDAELAAAEIEIKNSNLTGTRRAISDNESGMTEVKSVTVTGNTLNANVAISAADTIVFTGNNVADSSTVSITSYTDLVDVTATGNTMMANEKTFVSNAENFDNVQKEFQIIAPVTVTSGGVTKSYSTLQAALDAAQAGDTVTLIDNITLTEGATVPAGKAITLDLNGKTLTGTPAEAKAFAVITNRGELTITGNGKIVCDHKLAGSTGYAVNTIVNSGKLTVESGTIENKSTAEYQIGYAIDNNSTSYDAIVVINGGTVMASGSKYYDAIRLFANSVTAQNSVTVNGGSVSSIWMQNPSDGAEKNTKDVKGSVTITGGSVDKLSLEPSSNFAAAITGGYVGEIEKFQSAEGRDLTGIITGGTFGSADAYAFLADGFEPDVSFDANYKPIYGVKAEVVASVAGQNKTSLKDAVEAAHTTGQPIYLQKNVTLTDTLTIPEGYEVTLDLNGKTITGDLVGITNNGILTIEDSVGTGKVYTTDVSAQGRPAILNNGTLVINGGWFGDSNNDMTDRNAINRGNALKNYGVATINGGYFTNVSNQYIDNNAYAYAINNLSGGEITINNATVYGDINGLIFADGKVVVNDGSFTLGRPGEENNLWYLAYGDVEIKGGNWNRAFAVPSWNTGDPTFTGDVAVSGGTFNVDIEEQYCAEGYIPETNSDGTYGVKMGVYVARNTTTGVGYETLEDAMAAAKAGETVTLLADVTINANASNGYGKTGIVVDGVTLDGGEHTLTVNGANATWDSAINIKGGTVKNLTVKGAFRGIFVSGSNADIYLDNVKFEDVVYTFNSDAGNKNYGVYINNTALNGWTSYSNVHKEVVITNSTFGEGSGYAFFRPYNNTVIDGCTFETSYVIDGSQTDMTFENVDANTVEALVSDAAAMIVTDAAVNVYNTLADAIAAAKTGDTVKLLSDLTLTGETYTIPADKSITLDLNGKIITGTDNSTGSFALIQVQAGADLTVNDTVGTGKITLTATNDRGWSGYSSVISNQRGTLTVNGGTVEHLGGTDMAYGIDNLTNGKGTSAKTVVNGGTVKSPYRAIRQFMNGIEAENVLTVNGGTIEGGNKSIWMQDPSAKANSGKLTVGENASLKGNVYMDVTAGSTEWPVEISIAAAALKDGSEVIAEDLPAGYEVANVGGTYGVYFGVAKIGNTYFETLADAIAAAQAGDTITLVADTAMSGTQNINKSITIDGNGHKITQAAGFAANGANVVFDIFGNATVTFKNATFDAIMDVGIIRTVSANLVMDNCTVQNCEQTVSQGLLRLACGDATITNTKFLNNKCKMTVTFGYDAANDDDVLLIDGCTFEGNTCGDTAVVYFADGDYGKVTNTKFINNSVSATGNAATLYMGWGSGFEVSGCTFTGNSVVTSHTTTKRFASAIFADGCAINNNVFSNNTATRNGEAITTTVAVAAYYGAASVSENYWGGKAPVAGVDYTVEYTNNPVVVADYYTDADLTNLVTIGYVAKAGKYSFTTLAAAVAAAKTGDTVKLLSDLTLTGETYTIPADKSITLDMNGKKITATDNKAANISYELFYIYGEMTVTGDGTIELTSTSNDTAWAKSSSIFLNRGGVLNIEDGTFTHKGGTCMAFVVDNSGNSYGDATTNIEDGTLSSTYIAIRNRMDNVNTGGGTATLNVKGGTITGNSRAIWAQASSEPSYGVINISGGQIGLIDTARSAGATSMTTITGGTVSEFKGEVEELRVTGGTLSSVTIMDASGAVTEYVVTADGLYTTAVAQIGTTNYATLADAINAAQAGETVKLLKDITLTATVKVAADDKITLDLNGKTIDGTGNVKIALMSYGDLTLVDSSAEKDGVIKAGIGTAGNAVNICGGNFTMESGNIYSLNNALLIDENASTVTINGGKLTAETSTGNSAVMYISGTNDNVININGGEMIGQNGILMWNNTTVNIAGGSLTATNLVAIQGNGSKDNTKINISGDAVITGKEAGIYHPQGGELNISGNATVTGDTGIVVKGGNVTISGGTISGTGKATAYKPVSSGFESTGDGLYVEVYDNSTNSENYGKPTVTITGGTITSAYAKAVGNYANPNNNVKPLSGFISGGTYSDSAVIDYLAEGCTLKVQDGKYVVVPKPAEPVASVAGVTYTDLQEAINAADGEIVYLLKDVELTDTVTVPAGKNVTLNLKGHTISQTKECTASYEMISNKGNLTITGDGKISFTDTGAGDPTYGWGTYTIRNEGNLVVENGTIEHLGEQNFATHCIQAIFQYSGSTTINGGTISTPSYRPVRLWKGDMTINGGTFDGQVWVHCVDDSAKLTINGGSFSPNGGDGSSVFVNNSGYRAELSVTGGTFTTKIGANDTAALAGSVTGGNFTEAAKNGTNDKLYEGYTFTGEPNAEGYYTLEAVPVYAAQIGDKKFETLQAAVDSDLTGDIILLKSGEFAFAQEEVTIQKNGFEATVAALKGYTVIGEDTDAFYKVIPTSSITTDEGGNVAYIDLDNDGAYDEGDETKQTLKAALDAAESGYTVRLTGNVEAPNTTVIIPTGITLDIQSNTLEVKNLIGLSGSMFRGEPAAEGAVPGKLITAKNNLILPATPYYDGSLYHMPIWDEAQQCYLITRAGILTNNTSRGLFVYEEEEKIYFQFKHSATGAVNQTLFKDGLSDNAMSIIVRVEWSNELGTAYQEFVYNDVQVGKATGSYDYTFTLTGYSAMNIDLDTLVVTAKVVSNSGAVANGTGWRYADRKNP